MSEGFSMPDKPKPEGTLDELVMSNVYQLEELRKMQEKLGRTRFG